MTKVSLPFVRSAYNYNRDEASDESALECPEPSLTKQEFVEECDINVIIKRFGLGMELPENARVPVNSEFEEVFDFQSAMNAVVNAREQFMLFPAHVRARFHNDPAEMIDFVSNAENRDEAIKLGLVPRPRTPEEIEAERRAGMGAAEIVDALQARPGASQAT